MNAGMRTGRRYLHRLSLVLVASGLLATTASAAPISGGSAYTYSTTGFVGSMGSSTGGVATSDPYISYNGITTGQPLLTPGSFSLGSFQVASLASADASHTVNDLPFSVTADFKPADTSSGLGDAFVNIKGVINGTFSGTTTSDLTATVTSVNATGAPLPFKLTDLQVLAPQILSAPGVNGGTSSLYAYLPTIPQAPSIPEPTTLALFGVVLAVAGVHRFRVRRRAD